MSGTTCTCGDGHETYGACLRAKNIQLSPSCTPTVYEDRKSRESRYNKYAAARRQGIQPDGTEPSQVDSAVRISDQAGKAYDGATGTLKG